MKVMNKEELEAAKKQYKGCKHCKHFYNLDFDGFHTLCAELHCHLCIENDGWCIDYEEGEVPEERTRGDYK